MTLPLNRLALWSVTLLAGAVVVFAQEKAVPEKGIFLVADPHMEDPRFRQTVVLLLAHGEEGTLGLIINRAMGLSLARVMPDLEAPGKDSHTLYYGGPVGLTALIFLTRSSKPLEGAQHVMEDVYYSGDKASLEKLLKEEKPPDVLHLYVGHSGWSPGQLAREIAHGGWKLVRADPHTVFEKDQRIIWRDLIGLPEERRRLVVKNR